MTQENKYDVKQTEATTAEPILQTNEEREETMLNSQV